MVTVTNEWQIINAPGSQAKEFAGVSSDTKPMTDVPNGSTFFEMDTSTAYMFDASSKTWKKL